MKISERIVSKFQEGGAMPADPGAGAPPTDPAAAGAAPQEGGEDPLGQLLQMAMQGLQSQDCQAMAAVCEGLIQLAQGAQGGGGAPQEAPVYKAGGKLVKKLK